MTVIIHPRWRDQNEPSRFPFSDTATIETLNGLDLGVDTFLDAHLYPIGGNVTLHIPTITVVGTTVTIYIGTTADLTLCSASFDGVDPPDMLFLKDVHARPAGVLVSESLRLARFQSWSQGTHSFDEAATQFVADVCTPTPEIGVRGFITADGDVLTGDVWIVGENGVVIRAATISVEDNCEEMHIDIVGDPLFLRALCQGTIAGVDGPLPLFTTPTFLKTLNNVSPDINGTFMITTGDNESADNILRVIPTAEGLRFEAAGQLSGDL